MSFAILGQVAPSEVQVSGAENIATSYPAFGEDLDRAGGAIRILEGGRKYG